jgi:hypothetical protein
MFHQRALIGTYVIQAKVKEPHLNCPWADKSSIAEFIFTPDIRIPEGEEL